MRFRARLGKERKRPGLRQAELAAVAGTDGPRQSLHENDRRSLRSACLARTAAARADVLYVPTGRRSEGEWAAGEFLSAYLQLPEALEQALARLLGDPARPTPAPVGGE